MHESEHRLVCHGEIVQVAAEVTSRDCHVCCSGACSVTRGVSAAGVCSLQAQRHWAGREAVRTCLLGDVARRSPSCVLTWGRRVARPGGCVRSHAGAGAPVGVFLTSDGTRASSGSHARERHGQRSRAGGGRTGPSPGLERHAAARRERWARWPWRPRLPSQPSRGRCPWSRGSHARADVREKKHGQHVWQ